MSYDIYLREQASGDVIQLDTPHIMTGGTYAAIYDEETGEFYRKPITDAWLNITYNYGSYYYEATQNDKRFEITDENGDKSNGGIRGIYGKTGAESIPMLGDMILRIKDNYQNNGDWITTQRKVIRYYDDNDNEVDLLDAFHKHIEFRKVVVTEDVYEGTNDNYWTDTAGNAIRPLYQLLAFANLRPDGIWDGD